MSDVAEVAGKRLNLEPLFSRISTQNDPTQRANGYAKLGELRPASLAEPTQREMLNFLIGRLPRTGIFSFLARRTEECNRRCRAKALEMMYKLAASECAAAKRAKGALAAVPRHTKLDMLNRAKKAMLPTDPSRKAIVLVEKVEPDEVVKTRAINMMKSLEEEALQRAERKATKSREIRQTARRSSRPIGQVGPQLAGA